MSSVLDAIERQPQWSDVPVILLTRPDSAIAQSTSSRFQKLTNLTLLDRPTSSRALVSAVAAAIRARERQYQIRDQLDSLQAADTALRESAERMSLGVQVAGLGTGGSRVRDAGGALECRSRAALWARAIRTRTVSRAEFLAAVHPDDRDKLSRNPVAAD